MRIFKWLSIPNGQKEQIKALETWTVEWTSRHGQYGTNTSQEFEVFLSRDDAEKFKTQLQEAFKLIRHTSDTYVKVYQRNY